MALLLSAVSCGPKAHFQATPSGLEYLIVDDASGQPGKEGDFMKIQIRTVIHDTVIMDTREDPPGYRWLPLQKSNGQPYDMMEGLALLSKGDSAEFLIPADSVMKNPMSRPPFVKNGDTIHIYVRVLDVRSEEQYHAALEEESKQQKATDDAIIKAYVDSLHWQAEKTENGVYVIKTKEGNGPQPQDGQQVSVMYTGKTLDGEAFDSNVDSTFHHTEPLTFMMGRQAMIPGMEEGLKTLHKGGEATLVVPSGLAYGPMGRAPKIKPNEVLLFEVALKDVTGKPTPPPPPAPQP